MKDNTTIDEEADKLTEQILDLCVGKDSVAALGSMFECILYVALK